MIANFIKFELNNYASTDSQKCPLSQIITFSAMDYWLLWFLRYWRT